MQKNWQHQRQGHLPTKVAKNQQKKRNPSDNGTCNNGAGDTASILSWAVVAEVVGGSAVVRFSIRHPSDAGVTDDVDLAVVAKQAKALSAANLSLRLNATVILVYPVGVPVIFAILLFRVRRELQGERETLLSSALGFLHREYEPRYFWWARRSTACRVP